MKLKYYLRGLGMGIVATMLILGLRNDTATAMSDEAVIARAKELGMIENTRFLSELQAEDITNQTESVEETTEETVEQTTEETTEETAEETSEQTTEAAETLATETEGEATEGTDEQSEESEETNDSETDATGTDSSAGEETSTPWPEDAESTENSESTDSSETLESDEASDNSESQKDNDVIYSDAPVRLEIKSGASSYTVCKDLEAAGLIRDADSFDQYLISNGYSTSIRVGIYELLPGTNEKDIAKIITGK